MVRQGIVCILLLVFFAAPAGAISGYVELEYNLLTDEAVSVVHIYEEFGRLTIGTILTTCLMGIGFKDGWFPSGIPRSQQYEIYFAYSVTKQITISINNWCNHYFSQSNVS